MRKDIMIIIMIFAIAAISGCTGQPVPTPIPATPTAAPEPTVTPTATAAPTATVTATPTATVTATPTPEPIAAKKVIVKDIEIYWDTVDPLQYEKVTFTLQNVDKNETLLDVGATYRVKTPIKIMNYDGTYTTNTKLTDTWVSVSGMLTPGDSKKVAIDSDKHIKGPSEVEIIVGWRGGSEVAFNTTLNVTDKNFGYLNYM